jgi:hypothetical protein
MLDAKRLLSILTFYLGLAEIPGVARVDHKTKCVSLVAISLSHNCHLGTDPKENTTSERSPKKIPPHCCRYQETDLELTKKKMPPLQFNSIQFYCNFHRSKHIDIESVISIKYKYK